MNAPIRPRVVRDRFVREDRKGRFEVTVTATFTPIPVTQANAADWLALADRLTRPPRSIA